MEKVKPYTKIITSDKYYGVAAIYEPHPFRNSLIQSAVRAEGYESIGDTGIDDNEWCWVYYDWVGNGVGTGSEQPEGEIVEMFTEEHFSKANAEILNRPVGGAII